MAAPNHPKGAKSDKIWRDAIMRAVRRLNGDPVMGHGPKEQRLDRLADALVCKGIEGDVAAIREIADRLDGKAIQAIEHSGEIETNYVARVPAAVSDMDAWESLHSKETLQ